MYLKILIEKFSNQARDPSPRELEHEFVFYNHSPFLWPATA